MDEYFQLDRFSGFTWTFHLSDCFGTLVTPADVSSISYTIYKSEYGEDTPVEGHTNVNVSTSKITEEQTDVHTGEKFNFLYTIPDQPSLPYPESKTIYKTVFKFVGYDGISHSHTVMGVTS